MTRTIGAALGFVLIAAFFSAVAVQSTRASADQRETGSVARR